MSVYVEAVNSGRLAAIGWSPSRTVHFYAGAGPAPRLSLRGIRRALREAKRSEADERNAETPTERTKAHRRFLARREAGRG